MSSKKTPHIAGLIAGPGRSTPTVTVAAGTESALKIEAQIAEEKRGLFVMGFKGECESAPALSWNSERKSLARTQIEERNTEPDQSIGVRMKGVRSQELRAEIRLRE